MNLVGFLDLNIVIVEGVYRSSEDKQSQQRLRYLVVQSSDQCSMLNGLSIPYTNHSTIDDKHASIYRHIRSRNPCRSGTLAREIDV